MGDVKIDFQKPRKVIMYSTAWKTYSIILYSNILNDNLDNSDAKLMSLCNHFQNKNALCGEKLPSWTVNNSLNICCVTSKWHTFCIDILSIVSNKN